MYLRQGGVAEDDALYRGHTGLHVTSTTLWSTMGSSYVFLTLAWTWTARAAGRHDEGVVCAVLCIVGMQGTLTQLGEMCDSTALRLIFGAFLGIKCGFRQCEAHRHEDGLDSGDPRQEDGEVGCNKCTQQLGRRRHAVTFMCG